MGLLFGSLEDLWQQLLGVGIGSALLARDHYVLLVDAASDPERQMLLAGQLRDQRVDGGLIVQPLDPSDERWSQLAESLPIVSIGDALHGGQAAGEVVFDNRSGVHTGVGAFAQAGPSTDRRPIPNTSRARRIARPTSTSPQKPSGSAST